MTSKDFLKKKRKEKFPRKRKERILGCLRGFLVLVEYLYCFLVVCGSCGLFWDESGFFDVSYVFHEIL